MTEHPVTRREEELLGRIADLEAQLQESEETLGAIRRGEVDALVVGGRADEKKVYTLDSADRPYRVLIEQIQEGAVTFSEDGTILYCNRRLADLLGVAQERVVGHTLHSYVVPDQSSLLDDLLTKGQRSSCRGEIVLHVGDGIEVPILISLSPLDSGTGSVLICGVLTDLTEQKLRLRELGETNARLEGEMAERGRVEEALRQSQKMEAVGQLTGGLAHDFNNLLTGVTGSLELMQTRIAQGRVQDVERYVTAAQGAAKRAAALTHRLLAFSRRQTLDPKPTDVNHLVGGMEDLVRRTVGPGITVEPIVGNTGIWPTLVDAGQLENALLNLCINARDAMPDGGKITIETANRWLDERMACDHDLSPGQYVTLSVSDNGTGMTPEVIAKAFDPFFTTKPIGSGTGLGLSMIYGFAKQSGGQVCIYSEVGHGTMVCLYLPRYQGEMETAEAPRKLPDVLRARAGQTVLVVDDEPTVRMLVLDVLEDLGYKAIEAADGAAGLKILRSDLRIDLLVTDVGLPGGMNGRQMADAARLLRPDLKVLFITGYAENAVLGDGHLDPSMHVLIKPFPMDVLASRIRELIVGIP